MNATIQGLTIIWEEITIEQLKMLAIDKECSDFEIAYAFGI